MNMVMNFWVTQDVAIARLAEEFLAPQEGLCSMELLLISFLYYCVKITQVEFKIQLLMVSTSSKVQIFVSILCFKWPWQDTCYFLLFTQTWCAFGNEADYSRVQNASEIVHYSVETARKGLSTHQHIHSRTGSSFRNNSRWVCGRQVLHMISRSFIMLNGSCSNFTICSRASRGCDAIHCCRWRWPRHTGL